MFYYAQKAVLHPTAPLYVAEEREVSLELSNVSYNLLILFWEISWQKSANGLFVGYFSSVTGMVIIL